MVPIKERLDQDDRYVGTNKIKYIVIHDTGNVTDSDEGNLNYFNNGLRNASAHYFVDDDSIGRLVKDTDGAWHCGDGLGKYGITNNNSLSIEMCRVNNTVTAKTEANTLDLVRLKMKEYNIPASRVVRHYDASRKICPSSFSGNNWARWNAFKAKLVAPPQPAKPTQGSVLYRVSAGSFGNRANAEAVRAKLKGIGIETFLLPFKKDGKEVLRVIAGSYSVRKNAEDQIALLNKKGFNAVIAIYNK